MKKLFYRVFDYFVAFLFIITLSSCGFFHKKIMKDSKTLNSDNLYKDTFNASSFWWEEFKNEELNKFVNLAFKRNYSLKIVYERIEQARYLKKQSQTDFFPTINLISEISNKKTSNQNDESYSLGGFASYELDLWGRVYSSYKAKDYNFKISQQDYEISKITLASEIVKTFYQIVLYKKKMKIVSRDISLQKKHFDILRLKYQKADANINDKLSSKEKLNSLKAKKLEIKLSLNKLEKQLLVLIGKSPKDKLNISSGEFPRILKTLKNNLPIDLLSKRPDIIKSSLQISVANWNLSSSKSNRFPKISLSGSYNYSSSDYGDLFDNWIKNLAANLTLPIIDAGNKRLEVRKNDSILQEKLYNYKQTVLDAVKEVQNALYDDKIKKQYLDALSDNYNISIEKEKISKLKYQKAYINYLSFLQIQKDTNSSLDSKETAYYELILARINLYKSLAQKIGEYHTND